MEFQTDTLSESGLNDRRLCRLSLCLGMLALLAGACSHSRDAETHEAAFTGVFTPQPPAFLTGPMAVLLTNTGGFSAHVTIQTESLPGHEGPQVGTLLGRGGQLLFAPEPNNSGDRPGRGGGFSFIWDVAGHRGYVLSEALQGYAPLSSQVGATNVVETRQGAMARVAGHECQPEVATVQMSDGTVASFHVLRGTDLKGFPVHISAATNAVPLTLSFSKIRLEPPPAELFAPPEGFTPYSSPEAMVDELVIRQHNLKRKGHEEPLESTPPQPGMR